MEGLTPRQEQVLEFIRASVRADGYPPTVREICAALDLSSPSTVHAHLANLERLGLIKRDPTKPRALDVVGDARPPRRLPLIGSVAAGAPITAEDNVEDLVDVPGFLAGTTTTSCFACAGLHDGPASSTRNMCTFGMTAFLSYGLFWLTLVGLIVFPKWMGVDGPDDVAMGWYLMAWGVFTGLMFIGTLRINRSLQVVFLQPHHPVRPAGRRRLDGQRDDHQDRRLGGHLRRPERRVRLHRPGVERALRQGRPADRSVQEVTPRIRPRDRGFTRRRGAPPPQGDGAPPACGRHARAARRAILPSEAVPIMLLDTNTGSL